MTIDCIDCDLCDCSDSIEGHDSIEHMTVSTELTMLTMLTVLTDLTVLTVSIVLAVFSVLTERYFTNTLLSYTHCALHTHSVQFVWIFSLLWWFTHICVKRILGRYVFRLNPSRINLQKQSSDRPFKCLDLHECAQFT